MLLGFSNVGFFVVRVIIWFLLLFWGCFGISLLGFVVARVFVVRIFIVGFWAVLMLGFSSLKLFGLVFCSFVVGFDWFC